jgi:hypothetical protein
MPVEIESDDKKILKVYKRIIKLLEKQLLAEKFNLEECDILITNVFLNFLNNSLHNITDQKPDYVKFRVLGLSSGISKVLERHQLDDAMEEIFKLPIGMKDDNTETMH